MSRFKPLSPHPLEPQWTPTVPHETPTARHNLPYGSAGTHARPRYTTRPTAHPWWRVLLQGLI